MRNMIKPSCVIQKENTFCFLFQLTHHDVTVDDIYASVLDVKLYLLK